MTRLARAADGTLLLGDENGFVPLAATNQQLELDGIVDALCAATHGLSDPDTAMAGRIPSENLAFDALLSPDELGKLWGIGLNYAEHAADLDETRPDEPASFMKPTSAATGPGGPIRLPPCELTERVTAEGELAVVIGRTCHGIDAQDAEEVIAGYLPIIDMTAEDILEQNPRFLTRAKSFDTFFVLGPWLETLDSSESLDDIEVRTVVNGEIKARNTVEHMLFDPRELVAFHSHGMTLEPGDIISTGTPGAHPIEPDDEVRTEINRIGSVTANVVR
jgi:2-keto-4-pentenoate hydratase/2-oxohepta-3-ene-1,7-dioic acid hydratase in catechol pathway